MFTIILAFLNDHYHAGHDLLFIGTFIIDMALIEAIAKKRKGK